MDCQSQFYFTAEEILAPYRFQITEWYCEDHKTVEEIASLCMEWRLSVRYTKPTKALKQCRADMEYSFLQIHNCLVSWSIIPSPHQYTALAAVNAPHIAYDEELVASPTTNATPSTDEEAGPASSSPGRQVVEDEESCIIPSFHVSNPSLYTSQYPSTSTFATHTPSNQTGNHPHDIGTNAEVLERHRSLDSLPRGPSQLEIYTAHVQPHEKLAVGLEKDGVTQRHCRLAWYKRPASDIRRNVRRMRRIRGRLERLEMVVNRSARTV